MQSLLEFQRRCVAALLDPALAPHAPRVRANGISPIERLAVYRNNVFQNYRRALASTYPAIERLVGAAYFTRLCDAYVRRYRSRAGDVGEQGAWFADFLSEHDGARDHGYLPDVARLEWAIECVFSEADRTKLDLARLADIAPEHYPSLRLLVAPAVRLLASRYPIERIRVFALADQTGPQTNASSDPVTPPAQPPTLDDGPVCLLVRRQDYAVVVEPLAEAAYAMLDALQSGHALDAALSRAREVDAGFDPAACLRDWLDGGVLVDFCLAAETHAP